MSEKEIDLAWMMLDQYNSINKKELSENDLDGNELTVKEMKINKNKNDKLIDTILCKNCKSDINNTYNSNHEIICWNCGLIQSSFYSSIPQFNANKEIQIRPKYTNTKLDRMQKWTMWSNDEKNEYKLINYTREFCNKLNIPETLLPNIFDVVKIVMNAIKTIDGTKRARVKDGIILSCIEYVCKNNSFNLSINKLSKQINLDIKYITRAEKIILELINNKHLQLDKSKILETETPYFYVENVINKKSLNIPTNICEEIKKLIHICEANDILLDHTPLSIGVCCFYYILYVNNINIDIKIFSDLYDLSVVTVTKTLNKLKIHEKFINKNLNL